MVEGLLEREDLKKLLGCTDRTLRRYELMPDGLPHISIGNRKYYRASSVERWIASRETWPNPRRGTRAA